MIRENQLCLIVGGAEHRPEDIGKQCVTFKFLQPGEEGGTWIDDINECGEAAWLVEIDGDGAFKHEDWLLPIDNNKFSVVEDIWVTIPVEG